MIMSSLAVSGIQDYSSISLKHVLAGFKNKFRLYSLVSIEYFIRVNSLLFEIMSNFAMNLHFK